MSFKMCESFSCIDRLDLLRQIVSEVMLYVMQRHPPHHAHFSVYFITKWCFPQIDQWIYCFIVDLETNLHFIFVWTREWKIAWKCQQFLVRNSPLWKSWTLQMLYLKCISAYFFFLPQGPVEAPNGVAASIRQFVKNIPVTPNALLQVSTCPFQLHY